MEHYRRKVNSSVLMLIIFICFFLYPMEEGRTKEESSIPTIEDLTGGKVKIGDLIGKNNVDLVKEYVPASVYEAIQQGMVLIMGEHLPSEELVPKYFWEATEKNKGKAVIVDENATVYLKDGSTWPGGIPFTEPKTALEVMANNKYGLAIDDFVNENYWMFYINKEGESYKTAKTDVSYVFTTHRMKVPPLGSFPGMGNESHRILQIFTEPLKMKGIGRFTIRYYNESKNPDSGFSYLPAFKRAIRVSATTYQDNAGGSDFLYCDPMGINDPYYYWKFKLLGKKYMLTSATKAHVPLPLKGEDGKPDKNKIKFDVGEKYIRLPWAITPVYIVEGTPTVKHVYGKKVWYVPALPFWLPSMPIQVTDIYDRSMKIYKCYISTRGGVTTQNGDNYSLSWGFDMHDLQTGHSTRAWYTCKYNTGADARTYTLKRLLEYTK